MLFVETASLAHFGSVQLWD